ENIFTAEKPGEGDNKLVEYSYDIIDDIILALDVEGRIKLMNKRAGQLMGFENNDYYGKSFADIAIPEEERDEYRMFIKKTLKDRKNHGQVYNFHVLTCPERKETSFIRSYNHVISKAENSPLGLFIHGRIAEEAVHVISGTANTDTNTGKKDKNQRQATSEFIANISHDIRTPLSAIMGFTEQLMQTGLDKKQEEYLEIIDKSSEHLYDLVNDLLVYSRSEARQIKLDAGPFKIHNTIKYAFKSLKAKAKEKNIRFFYEIDDALDVIVIGDSFRLRQVLLNMLSNAIKFTDRGYVKLRCMAEEKSGDYLRVRFDITDTGIGISPDNLKNIFSKFRQADPGGGRKYGGTGLGLTICKNLIELQDGSLSVSSRENEGSTFSFTLPYEKAKISKLLSDDTGLINKDKLKGRKILLVEDDSINRLLGKTILEKFECSYDLAVNGRQAIRKIDNNYYELVLLDINLPDINGLDIAKYIRNEKKDNKIKIVAFSAVITAEDIREYKNAGMDDFLLKPYKEINLYNTLCNALDIEHNSRQESKTEVILKEGPADSLYDLSGLKEMIGSNKHAYNRVLNEFITNSQNTINLFKESMDAGDWTRIGKASHKILPSYRHLKVNSVIPNLEEINRRTGVDSNADTMPELLDKTIRSMEKVLDAIKKELSEALTEE
ncbi:MAG: ATP-binding protein, partial [Bacteroidales bacterium]